MSKFLAFLKRKDVVISAKRYGIDALGAMAQGLFCTLLVGTILNTIGQQFGIAFLNEIVVSIGTGEGAAHYTIGGLASLMVGPGIAAAIGFALHCPPLVLFSLIPVGFAANAIGGTEIRINGNTASLMDGENEVCTFPTSKSPRENVWRLD